MHQIMAIICIKMMESFLMSTSSPCLAKQTKAIFALGWFVWTGEKKEMVDAFIKRGNLLNGLWQSHWRSLFRCRWLPPWLPLSLAELPVRERRKLPPVSTDWQSITLTVCLYIRLTDCTPSQRYTPSQPTLAHTVSSSLCINSLLMHAKKANKPSAQLNCYMCMKAQKRTWSWLS